MSRNPMITILTMYNIDNTIFDDMKLPEYHFPRMIEYDDLFLIEGWTLDKETLINNIILECAELELLYTDPEFLKFAIKTWAAKEYPVWKALYETLFYRYNPIWNKDGTIKESERQIRNLVIENERSKQNNNISSSVDSENIEDTDNTTINSNTNGNTLNTDVSIKSETGTEKNDKNGNNIDVKNTSHNESEEGNNDTTNSVSAFDNMNAFVNHDKSETDTDNTKNTNEIENNVSTNSENINSEKANSNTENNIRNENRNDEEETTNNRSYNRERNNNNNTINTGNETEINTNTDSGNIDRNNERIERGNIGVVTTQEMISAERDLVEFNIYGFIIDSFKARFCILLY